MALKNPNETTVGGQTVGEHSTGRWMGHVMRAPDRVAVLSERLATECRVPKFAPQFARRATLRSVDRLDAGGDLVSHSIVFALMKFKTYRAALLPARGFAPS